MAEQVNGTEIKDAQTVDSRAAVHQATGMLSVQLEVPFAAALAWMQGYAFVHGQFVAEVAAEVVAQRLTFGVGDR
jgi:hypothetical protein